MENLTDFVGAESTTSLAAGVIGFSTTKLGRYAANISLYDLKYNFRGDQWGNNGPDLITRTLEKICATNNVSK